MSIFLAKRAKAEVNFSSSSANVNFVCLPENKIHISAKRFLRSTNGRSLSLNVRRYTSRNCRRIRFRSTARLCWRLGTAKNTRGRGSSPTGQGRVSYRIRKGKWPKLFPPHEKSLSALGPAGILYFFGKEPFSSSGASIRKQVARLKRAICRSYCRTR